MLRHVLIFFLVIASPVMLISSSKTVVCVGASITEGATTSDPQTKSYPAQLAKMLGKDYNVINCGVSSCTMLRKGDHPYRETDAYKRALKSKPDIVFIDLGGNDAKAVNRIHLSEFEYDCRDMIDAFRNLGTNPRIILLQPFVSFETDTNQIWDRIIVNDIIPRMERVAYAENVEILDMHSLLIDRSDLFPDNIHPNDEGSAIIARRLFEQLTLDVDADFSMSKRLEKEYTVDNFKGYRCFNFNLRGRVCNVVEPHFTTNSKPWIWRCRFWGHEPQTDIGLLERGFHVVYCDVAELMGNNEALSIWTDFYTLLTDAGLSTKSAMEGMSRGAMYAFSWAAANPDKISAVYVDNPLLDCRYLVDRESDDLNTMIADLMNAYNLKSKDDIIKFGGSPIDKVKEIVKGKYPILILCADQDEAVPPIQTQLFKEGIEAEGSDIRVVMKHGYKHHPHSLPNPSTIIDFIIKSTEN